MSNSCRYILDGCQTALYKLERCQSDVAAYWRDVNWVVTNAANKMLVG